jgi:hypothetical protein
MPAPEWARNATPEKMAAWRAAARESELREEEEFKRAMKPLDDFVQTTIAEWLLKDERNTGLTVKEQAHQIGLDRSDYYKALKRQFKPGSKKQQRFDDYIAKIRALRDETEPPTLRLHFNP